MSIMSRVMRACRRAYNNLEMVRASSWSSPYFVDDVRCPACGWPHTFEHRNEVTGEKERWCCNCHARK